MDKKKRNRAPNFTQEEVRLLLKLAIKEKNILENKKTDSDTWKMKDETWQKISNLFNASSVHPVRSLDTLRQKYDGLKKNIKKKVNKNKAEAMKTGGGKPEYVKIDGPEKQLLEVLSISVSGLPALSDSDSELPQTTITGELLVVEPEEVIDSLENTEMIPTITIEEVKTYDLPIVLEDIEEKTDRENENLEEEVMENTGEIPEENTKPKRKNKNWNNWSPNSLKTKKHSALIPKKTKKDILNNKLDCVLELREELLRRQIDQVIQQERRAQQKHEKELKLLEIDILRNSKGI